MFGFYISGIPKLEISRRKARLRNASMRNKKLQNRKDAMRISVDSFILHDLNGSVDLNTLKWCNGRGHEHQFLTLKEPDVNMHDFLSQTNLVANSMLREKYKVCSLIHGIYDPNWEAPVIVDIIARERHKMVLVSVVPRENYTCNVVDKSLTAMLEVCDYCTQKYAMPCQAMCVAVDSRDDLIYYMA